MRIILFGKKGQLGRQLEQVLNSLGQLFAFDHQSADFENGDNLRQIIHQLAPDIIVNAAAYTHVDKAETETQKAYDANTKAVSLIAEETKRIGAWLIHYSTDYVFDGTKKGSYVETDTTHPLNVYGDSKLAGERAIDNSGCHHVIFRTSWVCSAKGNNFINTMLRLFKTKDKLQVIDDQIGAPTPVALIANITALVVKQIINDPERAVDLAGLYHLAPNGATSWYEFAQFILAKAITNNMPLCIRPENITPISTADYGAIAHRPKNSKLDCEKISKALNLNLPHWETGVTDIIRKIAEDETDVTQNLEIATKGKAYET